MELMASNRDGWSGLQERRSEPRIEARASVVMTPLAAVSTRLEGAVVEVSTRGVRVQFEKQLKELPRSGEVYRLQSRDDIMLCEVRHAEVLGSGAALGLKIVHWSNGGQLKRLVKRG
jgi:hypothetical protein